MWKNKTVSVVLTSYRERHSIKEIIDGFFDTGVVDEVVVVDNNAEEGSVEEIKKTREIEAIVHIYSSYNNTIAHVTDMSGRTITKVSGGMVTKHSRLKANPTIAMFVAQKIAEEAKDKHGKPLQKNAIIQVLADGYTLHGKVVRPVKVKVAK